MLLLRGQILLNAALDALLGLFFDTTSVTCSLHSGVGALARVISDCELVCSLVHLRVEVCSGLELKAVEGSLFVGVRLPYRQEAQRLPPIGSLQQLPVESLMLLLVQLLPQIENQCLLSVNLILLLYIIPFNRLFNETLLLIKLLLFLHFNHLPFLENLAYQVLL
jgi:hypothetical protein